MTLKHFAQANLKFLIVAAAFSCGGDAVGPPPSVATVKVVATTTDVMVGKTLTLSAQTLSASGSSLPDRVISWASSDTSIATVTQDGVVTGRAQGSVTISATSEGQTGSVQITVLPEPVTITSVTPAILVAGQQFTITGAGFSSLTTADTVLVDGKKAVVGSATRTQIVATVPTGYACLPAHGVSVSVAVQDRKASATQSLRVGSFRDMAVGQSAILSNDADIACTELPGGTGEYLLVVINRDDSFSQTQSSFRLTGKSLAGLSMQSELRAPVSAVPATKTVVRTASHSHAAHFASLPRVTTTVGETRTFWVPAWSGTAVCSIGPAPGSPTQITARAVYVGSKAIVWEDVASRRAGQVDNALIKVGQQMDQYYPVVTQYFGDPLATDDVTDNDDHFGIIFSPKVSTATDGGFLHRTHLNGFYSPCDFTAFKPSVFGTGGNYSNLGEYVYEEDMQFADFPSELSVAHTLEHLITAEIKFLNPSAVSEFAATTQRLEEAMALTNQEIFTRTMVKLTPWKSNAGFQDCCTVSTSAFGLNDLNALKSVSSFGLTGAGFGNNLRDPYGVQWSFIRWYVDRFAADEREALKILTRPGLSLQSLSDLVVLPKEFLLGNWAMALYLDDLPQFAQNADVNIPTWNLRAIFAEMNKTSPPTYFLNPVSFPFGDFSSDRNLSPTSVTLYLLNEVGAGAHTFSLLGPAGAGPARAELKMGIARIK